MLHYLCWYWIVLKQFWGQEVQLISGACERESLAQLVSQLPQFKAALITEETRFSLLKFSILFRKFICWNSQQCSVFRLLELLSRTIQLSSLEKRESSKGDYRVATLVPMAGSKNLIVNPTFIWGSDHGWQPLCCSMSISDTLPQCGGPPSGHQFYCIAHNRTQLWQGIAQDITSRLKVRNLTLSTEI